MLFHPIINQLANLDMTFLVKPAENQCIEGQTACFCPFCQKEAANDDAGSKAKQTPHLIIYKDERGGLYNGVGVDDDRQAEHGAVRWMCTKTGKHGYGALELYAAMRNLPMHGASLLRLCHDLVVRVYGDAENVRAKYPMLFSKMDYRTIAVQNIDTFSFIPKVDFNPQELAALGCEVTMVKGLPSFGFGRDFNTKMLNDDFRIYAVDQVTLPNAVRDGKQVSEVIYGTPWNPLFVCFATDVIAPQGSCGCLFRPAMQQPPIVFSTTEEHSVKKVSRWLMGDKVFTYAMDHRDSNTTGVHAAISKWQPDEVYTESKKIWVENELKDGTPKGTFHQEDEEIPAAAVKAQNIIFCRTPEDAISIYYAMRSLRKDKDGDTHFQQKCWYHVAFSVGRRNFWYIDRGQWRQEKLDFNAVQYQKMKRFAEKIIMLYPNDISSQRDCGAIATKYSDLCYAMLPDAFRVRYNQRWQWLYGCSPRSVRDYMLTFRMTDADNFRFDHDIRLPLYSKLRGANNTDPFEIEYPRDPRSGKPKPPTCKVSPTKVWLFMTSLGYYRMIDPESTDLVGQFIHLDRCFVEYIDSKSIIQAVKTKLLEFIEQSWRYNDEEQRMMSDAANLIDKNFSEKSAGGLQSMVIDFNESFNERMEYFFFRNVALKITPEAITPVSYDHINFFIPTLAKKPYDFTMRVFHPPFTISESQEYLDRKSAIDQKAAMRNEDGSPVFSNEEITQMRVELSEWAQTFRWQVDWHGKQEKELWPVLRVIRGCSNTLWRLEQDAIRNKKELDTTAVATINSHFANMISCIGRICYRSWKDMQSVCPYLLEDQVEDEKEASGGSGKSLLVNTFVASAINVLRVDMKDFTSINNAQFSLSDLEKYPGKYRLIHWEDKPASFPMKYFYNKVTAGAKIERKFGDPVTLKLEDSPVNVITSNSQLSDDDSSTIGRFPLVSLSDRFCRANHMQHQLARSPLEVMKNLVIDPEQLNEYDRNQAIYICALSVQFIMKYHEFVIAPQKNVQRRLMVRELTENSVKYFEWFFARQEVYAAPICTDEMFNEFMRDWADASEGKSKEYSRATFKKKIRKYCKNMNIIVNPEHLLVSEDNKRHGCFKLRAWVTKEYFVGKEWENDDTVEPKYIRKVETSKHVYFFFRSGKDHIPDNYDDLKRMAKEYVEGPDPLPYRDDDGNIITLTTEEEERWKTFVSRRQGRRTGNQNTNNGSNLAEQVPKMEDNGLPF